MDDVYCPSCSAPVIVGQGPVVIRGLGAPTISIAYHRVVFCTRCPLVSVVTPEGYLTDLDTPLTMADIEYPMVPNDELERPMIKIHPPYLGERRDS